jgi:L-alanine-DL-glutamate epimerase-like enolase superfamily enzyme
MRITEIKATTVSVPLEVPMRHAAGTHPRRFVRTIVQVFTDEGITGLNVFGMDEESAHGGLEAVQEMGIDDSNIMLFGFGLAGDEDKSRLQNASPWTASM